MRRILEYGTVINSINARVRGNSSGAKNNLLLIVVQLVASVRSIALLEFLRGEARERFPQDNHVNEAKAKIDASTSRKTLTNQVGFESIDLSS